MSVLVNLPSVIVCDVLKNWISLSDWNRLDASVCNHLVRTQYLNEIAILPVHSFPSISNSADFLNWVYLRGVRIDTIILENCHFVARKGLKFGIRYDDLKSITITRTRAQSKFAAIINKCFNLTSLDCSGIGIVRNVMPQILGCLKYVSLGRGHDENDALADDIKKITTHCTKLEGFSFYCKGDGIEQSKILGDILRKCTLLKKFMVVGRLKLFDCIDPNTTLLDDVHILENESREELNATCIAELIKRRPTMKRITAFGSQRVEYMNDEADGSRKLEVKGMGPFTGHTRIIGLMNLMATVSEVTNFRLDVGGVDLESLPAIKQHIMERSAHTLRVLDFCALRTSSSFVRSIVENCPHLTELRINLSHPHNLDFLGPNRLTSLSITTCGMPFYSSLLSQVLSQCCELSMLNINFVKFDLSKTLVKSLLSAYRNNQGGHLVCDFRYRETPWDDKGIFSYDGKEFTDKIEEELAWVDDDSDFE